MVVYLISNEGYTATSGDEWMRAALSEEALRLGRMLGQLLPGESESYALVALMELQASRNAARRGRGLALRLLHPVSASRPSLSKLTLLARTVL
jgi:predicted RNA polymerase sigma factor